MTWPEAECGILRVCLPQSERLLTKLSLEAVTFANNQPENVVVGTGN